MIYHVTTTKEWQVNLRDDGFAPDAFLREGFIHACSKNQLPGVLQRYFAGRNDLMLLYIDEQKLTCQLRYEPGTGNELFPHVYGRIDVAAIIQATRSTDVN